MQPGTSPAHARAQSHGLSSASGPQQRPGRRTWAVFFVDAVASLHSAPAWARASKHREADRERGDYQQRPGASMSEGSDWHACRPCRHACDKYADHQEHLLQARHITCRAPILVIQLGGEAESIVRRSSCHRGTAARRCSPEIDLRSLSPASLLKQGSRSERQRAVPPESWSVCWRSACSSESLQPGPSKVLAYAAGRRNGGSGGTVFKLGAGLSLAEGSQQLACRSQH